jgi:hypothetical protein
MRSLDDETFPEPLLSMSLDDENDDEHKDGHSHSYTLNSDSKMDDGSNQSTTNAGSSCSTSSTKSSMKKLFHKQFNMASTPASRDKRELMAKKSHSYQDLHLPSVRRRYSNVQSKVKLYIDSLQPPKIGGGNSNAKRTPLLRHKSMPETYQIMMQDDITSVTRDLHENVETVNSELESDLESAKHENILLCKKVDNMRIIIAQLKLKQSSISDLSAGQQIVNPTMCAVATQTDMDTEETNALAYELSATTSVKSIELDVSNGAADNDLLVQNSSQEVMAPKRRKKSVFIRRKFRKMFSCIEASAD